eukprot:3804196-Rhodomonas_salina.1
MGSHVTCHPSQAAQQRLVAWSNWEIFDITERKTVGLDTCARPSERDQLHSLQTSEVPSYATLQFRNQRLVEDSLIEQVPRTHDESWISQLSRLNK